MELKQGGQEGPLVPTSAPTVAILFPPPHPQQTFTVPQTCCLPQHDDDLYDNCSLTEEPHSNMNLCASISERGQIQTLGADVYVSWQTF